MARPKWKSAAHGPCVMDGDSVFTRFQLEAQVAYPGTSVSDIRIGNNCYKIPNEDIRAAVVDIKRDFDTRQRQEPGVSGPLRMMGKIGSHVMVRYQGFQPFVMRDKDWLALELYRKPKRNRT